MTASYDRFTKYFHWIIALIIAAEYVLVWLIPDGTHGPNVLASYHESFGIVVLVLMLVRVLWRFLHGAPQPMLGTPRWQVRVAAATHGLLYVLLIALPFIGWLWTSANGWQVTLFNVVALPQLIAKNVALAGMLGGAHEALATAVLGLVALHVAAALYHAVVIKDALMRRILP